MTSTPVGRPTKSAKKDLTVKTMIVSDSLTSMGARSFENILLKEQKPKSRL